MSMLALYLLAAHMIGDYVLQTRWQAARKLDDAWVRTRHVLGYCVPFVPIAFYAAPNTRSAVAFLAGLYVLHFLTDTRRAHSTMGDWIAWRFMAPSKRADEIEYETLRDLPELGRTSVTVRPTPQQAARAKVPPNPWPPIPLFVDQTLHLCQLALLGGLLLQ